MQAVKFQNKKIMIKNGKPVTLDEPYKPDREKTLAYRILRAHEKKKSNDGTLHIGFDAMISHDITYVGIIQSARASGMEKFPIPYALTNCHNSLCTVGGSINEDDHAFGLSAAIKYGGIYVPANQAVIHQFAREKLTGCNKMILGSDSHTRYGCYGTLGVGEGGGELAKQLLNDTWDIKEPEVVLVWLEGNVPHGIGPHDVALALVGETFPNARVKNKILEFAGPGVADLSMDFRIGVDVMTTETSCLSSIWITDDKVKAYYKAHGREDEYSELTLLEGAGYDSVVTIDLNKMESMIALPFHPSKVYSIHELQKDPYGIFKAVEEDCNKSLETATLDLCRNIDKDGNIRCDQGVVVGCSGGMYENISETAAILKGKSIGNGYFDLSVYPSSAPINLALVRDGVATDLIEAGAVMKPCFCGPCFGAGDTPAHNTLSIRHATRNFANREGSKPTEGQIAAVALMDARSIAATALKGGILTAATDVDYTVEHKEYTYSDVVYEKRCYFGYNDPKPETELKFGPNITDWPKMPEMKENLLLKLCAVIQDDVTTTDELIPSGDTSSYRSNPIKLSEFALSRRDPGYVERSKVVRDNGAALLAADDLKAHLPEGFEPDKITVGSCIFAKKPGDGSAREQAASCQKVLGGFANICYEYATKRYRSNCINWGLVPFTMDEDVEFKARVGDCIYVPGVREGILSGKEEFTGKVITARGESYDIKLYCHDLSPQERLILTDGCLMNYYAKGRGNMVQER